MQINLRHDPDWSIPVPHVERPTAERALWARETANRFAATAGLDDAALLPPTTEIVETDHLGPGFSTTLLERHGDHDFGFRRWLFVGQNATLGAVLGPVAPYGLAFVEEVAAGILRASELEGFEPATDRTRLEELDRAVTRVGEDWNL